MMHSIALLSRASRVTWKQVSWGISRRAWKRTGQSIVEYLIILVVIVVAIMAIRSTLQENMNSLFSQAADKVNEAAGALGSLRVSLP